MKNFYILVGDENTWKFSFESNYWGFSIRTKGLWRTLEIGDNLAFYVTKPIGKIIGFGKVVKKFENNELYWSDEKFFKKSLWPFKCQFSVIHKIHPCKTGIDPPKGIMLNQGRKKIPQHTFEKLIKLVTPDSKMLEQL